VNTHICVVDSRASIQSQEHVRSIDDVHSVPVFMECNVSNKQNWLQWSDSRWEERLSGPMQTPLNKLCVHRPTQPPTLSGRGNEQ